MGICSTLDFQVISGPSIHIFTAYLHIIFFYKNKQKRERKGVPWMAVSEEFQRDVFISL